MCLLPLHGRARALAHDSLSKLEQSVVSLQIKQMACLDTEGEVWKVKFAKFGNMLAASTAGNNSSSIYVWELRPTAASAASWVLHSRLNGNAAAGDDAMLEG